MAVADAAIEKTNEPHLGHSTTTRGDELLLEAILPALAAPQTSHRCEDFRCCYWTAAQNIILYMPYHRNSKLLFATL